MRKGIKGIVKLLLVFVGIGTLLYLSIFVLFLFGGLSTSLKDSNITVKDFFKADIEPQKKEMLINKSRQAGKDLGVKIGNLIFGKE